MSQLAYDEDGQHFQVPATVARWKVRRFNNPGGRGGAQIVYGEAGTPLFIDVDTDPSDFREAVGGVPGRYRLDGVDHQARVVEKVPPAYLMIGGTSTATPGSALSPPPMTTALEYALVEIVRANSEAIRAVTDKFGSVVEAVGGLVRAADGAGLPRRLPLGPLLLDGTAHDIDEDEDEDEDEQEGAGAARPASESSMVNMLGQVMQMVSMFASMRGGANSPKIGAVMGQVIETVKRVETASTTNDAQAAPPSPEEPDDESDNYDNEDADEDEDEDTAMSIDSEGKNGPHVTNGVTSTLHTTSPGKASGRPASSPAKDATPTSAAIAADPMAHFQQVLAELTPSERAQVQYVVTTLSVGDLMQWYDQLARMSVVDGAAMIRRELARVTKANEP
jgi:hypothetical protein